jgi:hypothetical protein
MSKLEPDQIDMMSEDELRAEFRKVAAEVARLREDNAQMCAALTFIAQSPHCLSIFDARARASSSLAVGYGLVKTEALATVREKEEGK